MSLLCGKMVSSATLSARNVAGVRAVSSLPVLPVPRMASISSTQCTLDPLSAARPHSAEAGRPAPLFCGQPRQLPSCLRDPRVHCAAGDSEQETVKRRRAMLKVSGEALQGENNFGIDPKVLRSVAEEVANVVKQGIEVAVVVGGGNYFRGVNAWDGLDRATADHMGMLATCMNAICLQSALDALGVETRVQTAIDMRQVAEPYIRRRAIRHLERGRVVIFGAGTGNPFFTTDTAAALRAAEIDADVFLKATKVDGVYDCDPMKNPNAKLHRSLTYAEVRAAGLAVMDDTAITLCKENDIPVVVFNLNTPGNITRALLGDPSIGTTVNSMNSEESLSTAVINGNGANRQLAMHFKEG